MNFVIKMAKMNKIDLHIHMTASGRLHSDDAEFEY